MPEFVVEFRTTNPPSRSCFIKSNSALFLVASPRYHLKSCKWIIRLLFHFWICNTVEEENCVVVLSVKISSVIILTYLHYAGPLSKAEVYRFKSLSISQLTHTVVSPYCHVPLHSYLVRSLHRWKRKEKNDRLDTLWDVLFTVQYMINLVCEEWKVSYRKIKKDNALLDIAGED